MNCPTEGFRELWGRPFSSAPPPSCRGGTGSAVAYIAANVEALSFAMMLRGWTSDVVPFSPMEGLRFRASSARCLRPVRSGSSPRAPGRTAGSPRRSYRSHRIQPTGPCSERDVLFVHPLQRQVDVVRALGVAPMKRGMCEWMTQRGRRGIPGIHAAGDLTTSAQGALLAAAFGSLAAARLNHALTLDMATGGALAWAGPLGDTTRSADSVRANLTLRRRAASIARRSARTKTARSLPPLMD